MVSIIGEGCDKLAAAPPHNDVPLRRVGFSQDQIVFILNVEALSADINEDKSDNSNST